jgi:hypothetical protein
LLLFTLSRRHWSDGNAYTIVCNDVIANTLPAREEVRRHGVAALQMHRCEERIRISLQQVSGAIAKVNIDIDHCYALHSPA